MSRCNRERNIAARNAEPLVGSYVCDPAGCSRVHRRYPNKHVSETYHCWHDSVVRRLEWQGGPSANAAADLAAWNALGESRKDRAA